MNKIALICGISSQDGGVARATAAGERVMKYGVLQAE